MKKWMAGLMAMVLLLSMAGAVGEGATDTVTVLVPPITSTYLDQIDQWAAEFEAANPGIKIEVTKTSWNDHNSKLSTMAAAGEAPDIAEISYAQLGKYVELGVAIEIEKYISAERMQDYDGNAMDYMSLESTAYGLPLYITIQAIGQPFSHPKLASSE